jgi:hypothetical protein
MTDIGADPVPEETRPIRTNTLDEVRLWRERPFRRAHGYSGTPVAGFPAALWRRREDFQNGFAARMERTVADVADANHPPVPALDHADRLSVRSGEAVVLSAPVLAIWTETV